jgi:hypothetical protein
VIFLLSVYNLPLSVFLLFLWRWRSRFAAWVLLFFGLQGRLKTRILMLVFWVYCLYWSLFYGFLSSVSPSFSFVPSLSVSLFCLFPPLSWGRLCLAFIQPATASVVVTVAPHPKCSVTDAFNEENVCVSCQRTKRLSL